MPELAVRLFVPGSGGCFCAQLLSTAPGIRLVSDPARFDVAILDAAALDCAATLKNNLRKGSKTLVLVSSSSGQECLRWAALGAAGVLPYRECPEQLVQAVRHVAAGRPWLPAQLASDWLLAQQARHAPPRSSGLTRREAEVAQLLLARLTNQEIAETLHLSPSTVKWHIFRIFRKFGVHTRGRFIALYEGHAAAATVA